MWKTVKIGDVCDLMTGGTPNRKKPEYFSNGHIKWLVSGDINQREIFDCSGRITEAGLRNSSAKFLPEDSVLIALNGQGKTRGTVALLRTKATCNQSLVAMHPKQDCELDPKFLFYVLDGMYERIRRITGDDGNDRRGLNMPLIRNIHIPYPPLAEQQRIVAKLDAAFAEIDSAISLSQLKIDELEKLITSSLKELGNINDAEEFTINTLCKELYAGGDAPSKDKCSLTRTDRFKIPIFSNGSKNAGLYGYCEEARTVEPAITISARGTIGYIELRHEPFLPIVRLIVAIPNTDIVQIKFLKYALLGSKIFSSGSSIPQLTVPMLRELPLRIPNLPTQKEIISKLDIIFELREKLQSIQNKKLVQLSALKSALLAQQLQSEAA